MLITCLRHATAEPYTQPSADAERALIKKGKDQVVRVAEFCRKNALIPTVLYSSPLLRARQTANLLHARLPDCSDVKIVDWLSPGFTLQARIDALEKLQTLGVNDVWLVGHEPDISRLIAHLLDATGDCIAIKKSSLTRIEADFNNSYANRLLWSIPCALMHV